ncbi:hypothetical protein [Bradyrhizobium sp. URHD0069]|uniref:hypothetical protein n=1 Tax=Bradyrhizobium sp. URHD0069 TaxID=1380355 RepID=UPI0004971DBB|nr:hypothetical protein [Bradyrhizobium sp. URHD0069]
MEAMEQIVVIPLKSAFRVWGRLALEEAYRFKLELELTESGTEKAFILAFKFRCFLEIARGTAWRELFWGLQEVSGLRALVGPESQREVIDPELLKTLLPDHERSSAKNDRVAFLDIQIRGEPPLNWPAAIGRDEFVWGPFDSNFIQVNDYENVVFNGESIQLQPTQAGMIRQLHNAYLEGRPDLAIKRLVPSGHISSYFKGQKAKLLRYPKRGFVQLNLD